MSKPITITLTSHKGGTGKTTITWGLATALALKGFKVLMIDLDEQGNLSQAAGYENPEFQIGKVLRDFKNRVLKGLEPELSWEKALIKEVVKNLDLMPAGKHMHEHEALLNTERTVEILLKLAIEKYAQEYDFVLIDCPPNKQIMTYNGLTAATHYIVPIQGENFAYRGLQSIYELVEEIKSYYNPSLQMAGVVLNRFRDKTIFGKEILDALSNSQGITIFDTRIRQCLPLMEATAAAQTIFDYAPDSPGAEDFKKLADEICFKLDYTKPRASEELEPLA